MKSMVEGLKVLKPLRGTYRPSTGRPAAPQLEVSRKKDIEMEKQDVRQSKSKTNWLVQTSWAHCSDEGVSHG